MTEVVGTLNTESTWLSVLKGTGFQKNITFDLRLWGRLLKLKDN